MSKAFYITFSQQIDVIKLKTANFSLLLVKFLMNKSTKKCGKIQIFENNVFIDASQKHTKPKHFEISPSKIISRKCRIQ